jgi:DNA-directed RNA polymerase subunit RPC12/RpoP
MSRRPKLPRTPRPELSAIGRLDNVCPYCEEELAKKPERKTACPHCGNYIFVRSRPFDRQRVLLTEAQTNQVEAEWTSLQAWSKRSKRTQSE